MENTLKYQYALFKGLPNIDQKIKYLKEKGLRITLIDKDSINDYREIEHAIYLLENKIYLKQFSSKLENEFLLLLAGERQFDKAIKVYGVKNNKDFVLVSFEKDKTLDEIQNELGIRKIGEFKKKIKTSKLLELLEKKVIKLLKD
jgi:tRNA threonylcarbamoyladenosine modification (KEOPS) complex Cgi121 subunit